MRSVSGPKRSFSVCVSMRNNRYERNTYKPLHTTHHHAHFSEHCKTPSSWVRWSLPYLNMCLSTRLSWERAVNVISFRLFPTKKRGIIFEKEIALASKGLRIRSSASERQRIYIYPNECWISVPISLRCVFWFSQSGHFVGWKRNVFKGNQCCGFVRCLMLPIWAKNLLLSMREKWDFGWMRRARVLCGQKSKIWSLSGVSQSLN